MNFYELSMDRYSCRALADADVEEVKINRIIDAALAAPTAVNKQPFRLWLVKSDHAVKKMSDITRFTFGAKVFLVVGAKSDEAWVRASDGRNFADVDASIVATHIMMAIHDEGLRSTWVGSFNEPLMKELFPEMKDFDLVAIFPIGYQAEEGTPSERHTVRRNREELVKEI